jgi:hypothetical protein
VVLVMTRADSKVLMMFPVLVVLRRGVQRRCG